MKSQNIAPEGSSVFRKQACRLNVAPEERPAIKPNTYSQIFIQIVFSVRGRVNFIPENVREDLQKYMTGIIQNRGQKLLTIYIMPDHVHLLVSIKPSVSISDLVRDVKAGASQFITEMRQISIKFHWQEGYGAFSYSKSQIDYVIKYINNQVDHHKKRSFKEEYIDFLRKFEINYDEKYLFEWYD